MKRALVYPAWKNWSVEHNEIKKRRIEERTEAFGGTLSVGRSSARIVGSVLFGRVEGVKEGRTRAAWQFPCHVSPTLGPAYDSDFLSVGSLPGPIGGPFLLVIRRVSLVRVARFLLSVGKRRRDRFSPEGCHFQLVVGASEQTKCPRCRHASELLFFLFFSLSDNERGQDVVERETPCICTRENGRLAFSPCSANFLRYTASRIQRQPTCLLSFNHTDNKRGSNRPGIESGSLDAILSFTYRDWRYLAIRVTNYGEKTPYRSRTQRAYVRMPDCLGRADRVRVSFHAAWNLAEVRGHHQLAGTHEFARIRPSSDISPLPTELAGCLPPSVDLHS